MDGNPRKEVGQLQFPIDHVELVRGELGGGIRVEPRDFPAVPARVIKDPVR